MAYGVVHQFAGGTKSNTRRRSRPCIPATAASRMVRCFMRPAPSAGGWTIVAITTRRRAGRGFVTVF